ncbi:MAG: c-type cytochrome [Kiloniellales bacterium]
MAVAPVFRLLCLGLSAGALLSLMAEAMAHEEKPPHHAPADTAQVQVTPMPGMPNMRMPDADSRRGRKLFAAKGCVACHSVNGVGGHHAKALDAHTMEPMMNPFEFAAKMWRMAPFMIAAQEEALGQQILFTGDELADIIAFVHDDEEQHHFSEADIPPQVHKWMDHKHAEPGGGAAHHAKELGHHHAPGAPATPHHPEQTR